MIFMLRHIPPLAPSLKIANSQQNHLPIQRRWANEKFTIRPCFPGMTSFFLHLFPPVVSIRLGKATELFGCLVYELQSGLYNFPKRYWMMAYRKYQSAPAAAAAAVVSEASRNPSAESPFGSQSHPGSPSPEEPARKIAISRGNMRFPRFTDRVKEN